MKLSFYAPTARFHCGMALCLMTLTGCSSLRNPDIAPAHGTIAGAGVGAIIGSASGSAGSGAVIGSLLGNAGGSIVRYHKGTPPFRRSISPAELPAVLEAAHRFDTKIAKDFQAISKNISQGLPYEREIAKNKARSVIAEADAWIQMMSYCERTASDIVSHETSYPTGNIGYWLNIRQKARTQRLSLQMHQSWFKSLSI